MDDLVRQMNDRLITYEEAVLQGELHPPQTWGFEDVDLKKTPEMQRAILWGVLIRLQKTGLYSDDDLIELARRVVANNHLGVT